MADRILIVDDEPNIRQSFSSLLKDEGHSSITAESVEEAIAKISRQPVELILLDLQLPGASGLEFLRQLRDEPGMPVVLVISGQADIPMALEAVRLGAVDFLEKPVQPEKLIASVNAALALATAHRQRTVLVEEIESRNRIIGQSPAIRKMLAVVDKVAPTDTTVLIRGENGTGKELVATRIYLQSLRRDRPYIKVNCPGIPETLFESELFGHLKGSFTGAVKDNPGKFMLADGGTIFLDEIGDLPLPCQAKLLRVLESGEIETLGATEKRMVDVRVLCATNRDLDALVTDGRFRQDLYYRISVFDVHVPPLAERRDDIPLLVGEFLRQYNPAGETTLSPEAIAHLTSLPYPGNVRQLRNVIERLTILCRGHTVQLEDVMTDSPRGTAVESDSDDTMSLADRLVSTEKYIIERTLRACDFNISESARRLKVDRANLSKKVKELGLKHE
jgi:two-component system nitrogen regulation response regulator NtrX